MSSRTVWTAFGENVRNCPNKVAINFLGTKYSYGAVKTSAEIFASALSKMGIDSGDRVVIYAPNSPQWIIAFLALQRLGAIAVPITPIYTPPDIKFICNNCDAKLIVCANTNLGYVLQALPETGLERVIVSGSADLLPLWKRVIGHAFDKIPGGRLAPPRNISTFKQMLKAGRDRSRPKSPSEYEDICTILYTGGTTGFPKGVPMTHAHLLESVYWQRKATETLMPLGSDIVMQGGALFHVLGLAGGLVAPLCIGGDTVILPPRVNLDGLMDWIQRFKATSLFGVPAFYRMILEHDRIDQYDLSSLRYCMVGGDSVPIQLQRRWLDKFGTSLSQAYGITEAGLVSISAVDEEPPLGSAGRVIPINEAKLVIPGTIELVPNGELGELLLSSRYSPKRYWNSPSDTKECFAEIDGKIWYRTKDIVRIDKDRWLYFVDREADMIKHKGYRIAAAEIERVLQEHPAVVSACAIGVPDHKVGERIKAFAVLKDDVKGISAQELILWCRKRLAPYKVPEYIEYRDSLPKSKVGKLLRREVRSYEHKKVEEIK
ncbi:class I adenylate-forming enzyme family protein [Thermodesulfobacteriota bacterium]